MFAIMVCGTYEWEASTRSPEHVVELCALLEIQENPTGGYARIAYQEGKLVADADGWHKDESHYVDAATATGMYDP